MINYSRLRLEAISFRKEGLSYSEILKKIPVAKSTLSLWLRDVGLAKRVQQRLTDKRKAGQLRGALVRKNQRIALTKEILEKAEGDIGKVSKRELWLIGAVLYWAEGSKEKEYGRRNSRVQFLNHDPVMIRLFLKWLSECCNIPRDDILLDIYIHQYRQPQIEAVKKYWAEQTGFPKSHFVHVYYKKNVLNPKRLHVGDAYFGGLKINVRRGSGLSRKIRGWVSGICKYWEVV